MRTARRCYRRSAGLISPWRLVLLDESGVRTDMTRTDMTRTHARCLSERAWDAVPYGR